ncbi:MAG: shikimate dehydrogenase, partial [Chloroflexi bacterium]|nr:shikimate dehydrogenase [Chloroflexota bacterium]
MHYIGLIGYPLSHSVSPAFQQVALDYHGLDARYVVWETRPEQLGDVVANIRHDENWGANVTVPHKERVMSFLDGLEGDAVAVGAVNVIYKEQARLLGNNTDVYGFLHALENDGRFLPAGGKALILGAGGAARAVVYGLVRSRMSLITIANRDILRARALAGDMTRFLSGRQRLESVRLVEEDLAPLLQGCDLIVNCTSLGMKGAQQEQTPFRGGLISN